MDQSRRDMFKQLVQNKPAQFIKNWLLEKAEEIASLPDEFEPTAEAAGRALGRQHRRKNTLSWETLLAKIPDGKADANMTDQNATQASGATQPITTETFPHE